MAPGSQCSSSLAGSDFSKFSNRSIGAIHNVDSEVNVFPWSTLDHVRYDLDEALRRMLATMPYTRGKLTMRADLGRILLANMAEDDIALNASGPSSRPWRRDKLTGYLNTSFSDRPHVHFTKVLTTYHFNLDAVFHFRIADRQPPTNRPATGARLWDSRTYSRTSDKPAQLIYSFYFSRGDDEYVIDVEDKGGHDQFSYTIHTHSGLGGKDALNQTYVHNVTGL